MKYAPCLFAVALFLNLVGCQPDQEDRDFFYSGWAHPQEGADQRYYKGQGLPVDNPPLSH